MSETIKTAIIKTIEELAEQAGPNGAIYVIGCAAIVALGVALKTKPES